MTTQVMKKLVALFLLSMAGTGVAEAVYIPQIIGTANYDNGNYAMITSPTSSISPTTMGSTWQNSTGGKYDGLAGIAGDGSSKIVYSSLPSGFSSNAGMVEFWFNTANSWAGLTLLDMGNGNQITWNASTQVLTAATTGIDEILSTNLGEYPGGWHHVALTWADSGWRVGKALYVDGSVRTSSTAFTGGVAASYLALGGSYNTTNYDEVHVYNSGFVDVLYNIYESTGGTLVEPGYYYQSSVYGSIPEPAMGALLLLGGAGVGLRRRRAR